jgi:hypothetical protein
LTMQKEEERQNRVLKEIIDNAKELPVESQNLLLTCQRNGVYAKLYDAAECRGPAAHAAGQAFCMNYKTI